MKHLAALNRSRGLLRLKTIREVRVRHKQSSFGAAWAIPKSLALTAVSALPFWHLAALISEAFCTFSSSTRWDSSAVGSH